MFLVMKIKQSIQSMLQKECCKEKHFGLLLTREEGIRNYNERF